MIKQRPQLGRTFHVIAERQRAWARRSGIPFDSSSRATTIEENLFRPLTPETHEEYRQADGNELGGKLMSLYSSSALVANVFDYWRDRPNIPAACFGMTGSPTMTFEKQHPLFDGIVPPGGTGSRRKVPNVDLQLDGNGDAQSIVVECKLTEPFVKYPETQAAFTSTYFRPEADSLWSGMERTKSLASRLNNRELAFARLNAPQLIKTGLACKRTFGVGRWRFIYLWFHVLDDLDATKECDVLLDELNLFQELTSNEIPLEVRTWREVFMRMESLAGHLDSAYVAYLQDRYFR